ncbi:hypothetical protein [uncultured Sphingomonas sp.]|uniref:hypothetical protein n=1 Tax=uncultured Sphingomonas sp. TaxID=158754 RepID=UPI0025EC5042|nr:hypothetical protein [uncultured Sphingomonas sp.]
MATNDGWEDVVDPSEVTMASHALLPSAPPSKKKGTGGVSPDDRKLMNKYRDASDAADQVIRNAGAFESREGRFHTGAGKAAMFGAMYPNTDGAIGPLKAAGGALLRGTVGYLYPDRDHADYQFLNSRAAALNNAALRMEKGVQTQSDEARIARENVGVDKSPQVNRDIIRGNMDSAAIAHARAQSAAAWTATHGGLTGTKNARGMTYDQWFNQVVAPQALSRAHPAPKQNAPSGSGWGIERIK